MQLPYAIPSLLALVSYAAAGVIEGRASTCNATNIAFINQRVAHAVYFCDFFLSYPRTKSPFALLGASDTWNACQCITASAASPRNYRTVTAPSASTCSAWTAILTSEYRNPSAYCSFYMYQDRTRSTIPGLSIETLKKACSCLTSTPTSTTTVTKTSTIGKASTTTSTCSNNALATAAGDFASGLASWTPTASPGAYASVATAGTSYDASGSAAQLKCSYTSNNDAHASICSQRLPLCPGQNYTVSFKYRFAASGSQSGSLGLYNYGWDEVLATVSGPAIAGGLDGKGVKAGTWGTVSETFTAVEEGDMVCVLLQCLSNKSLAGKSAQVAVDNVRVTRVQ